MGTRAEGWGWRVSILACIHCNLLFTRCFEYHPGEGHQDVRQTSSKPCAGRTSCPVLPLAICVTQGKFTSLNLSAHLRSEKLKGPSSWCAGDEMRSTALSTVSTQNRRSVHIRVHYHLLSTCPCQSYTGRFTDFAFQLISVAAL